MNNLDNMFTGIIQEIGKIKKITSDGENLVIEIKAEKSLKSLKKGDSLNLDGICSTVNSIKKDCFEISYMEETRKRTTVETWKKDQYINIEPALKLSDRLNGHIVAGHIDCIGSVKKILKKGKTLEIDISFPEDIKKFTAFKGSIAVNGISLTISHLDKDFFTVCLIPHTIKNTTLGNKKAGDKVNLEVDIISRYLKQLFDERDSQASYEFLEERGFI